MVILQVFLYFLSCIEKQIIRKYKMFITQLGSIVENLSAAVIRLFLTSVRNLQSYTISGLLEACYLCTSMGKLITKTCWINLLLYLLFFTGNKELKQPSRVIIREKQTLCMQKRTIRKSSKLILYCNSSSATHRLILLRDIETNHGLVNPNNQQTKAKSDRLPSSAYQLCNKTLRMGM